MASKVEAEIELKSDAEKIWKCIRESTSVFPKALPQHFESIQVVEGDGSSAGSVRLIKYPPGISQVSSIKEKVEAVDEGSKSLKYSVIEGDLLKYYKDFKGSLSVSSNAQTGSSVKWSCEFQKATEQVPDPVFIKDFAVKTFQDLDAYVLAN